MTTTTTVQDDPRLPVELLLRDLRAAPDGLPSREAARRLTAYGPNQLQRQQRPNWPEELLGQLVHPLRHRDPETIRTPRSLVLSCQ